VSRERIAARRKAGGRPVSTEYAGVDHNVWEWAFTEPELVKWLFAQNSSLTPAPLSMWNWSICSGSMLDPYAA